MPNIFQRLQIGLQAATSARDADDFANRLDTLVRQKGLPPADLDSQVQISKSREQWDRESKLDAHKDDVILGYSFLYNALVDFVNNSDKIPDYGTHNRSLYMADIWQNEPILAGAVYSMSAKMTALSWQVTGKRNSALHHARMFSRAAYYGGYGWGGFQASTTQDFYTLDEGVYWETPRVGDQPWAWLADIGHIDSLCVELTGDRTKPVRYVSELTSQDIKFRPWEYIHFSSMPSPREKWFGKGFCAVSRAIRAAKILIAVSKYDEEKLSNLPPEGVASVTGLTMEEFKDAVSMWKAQREQNNSLTFPQVLWLIGSQPNQQVSVQLTGFSSLPDAFNRSDVVTNYVNTLALDFGVDAREFWPISTSTLGTAAESEIQHMKAKGKGPGEYISLTERILNTEMPDGAEFAFDTQDIQEDMKSAEVAKAWIEAFLPISEIGVSGGGGGPGGFGGPGGPMSAGANGKEPKEEVEKQFPPPQVPGASAGGDGPKPLISNEEFKRILADKGVLPDWMVDDGRIVIRDADIHHKEISNDEAICIRWEDGVLKQVRMPAYTLSLSREVAGIEIDGFDDDVPTAFPLRTKEEPVAEEPKRNIRGKPIPEGEALRGASITRTAIEHELELWRKIPELQEYVPDDEEITYPR